jgi:hypothetical protein
MNSPDIRWAASKNEELKRTRGVSFEELVVAEFIAAIKHPRRDNQRILLIQFKRYIWAVPYVIREDEIFLKTAFPSRKYTKLWRSGEFI